MKFLFHNRRPSNLGKGRVYYVVSTEGFKDFGYVEGKPGQWYDGVLSMSLILEIRKKAHSYKTREQAAAAILDNWYGEGRGLNEE